MIKWVRSLDVILKGELFKKNLSLVVSTSRQIEIEIETVLSVETNFWKPSRFSRRSRSTFILSRSRFLKSRLLSRDKDVSRFLSRSSRLIETFETNRDKTRFFEIFVNNQDFVEINQDFVEINRDFVEIDRDFVKINWDFVEINRDFFLYSRSRLYDYFIISRSRSRNTREIHKNHKNLDKSR